MTEPVDDKGPKSGGRIQSIERAFAILEEAAKHADGISLSDLSRALDLHTSTLYHLIKTLTALGYLRRAENSKRYRVGRAIFSLAAACSDETELTDAARPFLEELSRATGESTHFAIWEHEEALILAKASGSNAFQMNERSGMLRPVYCTAIGKALLTGLPDKEIKARTQDLKFERHTPNTLKGPAELLLQVRKARVDGIAFDDCEYNAEIRCMAAPVLDFRGHTIGAIGFSGPVWRLSFTDMAEYIPLTKTIASRLSENLGFVVAPEADAL